MNNFEKVNIILDPLGIYTENDHYLKLTEYFELILKEFKYTSTEVILKHHVSNFRSQSLLKNLNIEKAFNDIYKKEINQLTNDSQSDIIVATIENSTALYTTKLYDQLSTAPVKTTYTLLVLTPTNFKIVVKKDIL